MPYVTYAISDGVFCTTDEPFEGEFLASWAVFDSDAYAIQQGADIYVGEDGLVVLPVPVENVTVVVEEPTGTE